MGLSLELDARDSAEDLLDGRSLAEPRRPPRAPSAQDAELPPLDQVEVDARPEPGAARRVHQPLAVDLFELPKPSDITVVCTNVRTVDGKKPVMIDFQSSTFVFPMAMVRFVEIPQSTAEAERAAGLAAALVTAEPEDLEIDEDFLRRVREA